MAAVALLMLALPWLVNGLGGMTDVSLQVIRQNKGDVFSPEAQNSCQSETCVGLSSGTASAAAVDAACTCQCHPHLPAFREDLRICVDDIHECILAPFVGGSTSQSIPFVFLPLKGQIIHPSKEISFSGIQTPVCAVSGAKFLTESGWVDLRNPIDTDVPFRLFRDEGRTFLQWVGESDLRTKMSGRLVLVYLMCRELATSEPLTPTGYTLFSPCVAFRVVGSPAKYPNNVSEVAFSQDSHSAAGSSGRLSVSEYVAIGTCSILLGLIYVASVFLYVHLRKRNREAARKADNQNLTNAEEGVVKSNPLLSMGAHFQPPDTLYNDSTNSEGEMAPDVLQHAEDKKSKTAQMTSALIHSQYQRSQNYHPGAYLEQNHQDPSSIEKLPEENVSIVETLEGRDERSDSLKALTGTVRRKLYFNPAYFEPQLLLAPPPAALEFLAKIREVITIAKQKMSAKRFSPSLMGIPEEDNTYGVDFVYDNPKPSMSRRSSVISLKRENSRRKTCTGCPGCEPQLSSKIPEFNPSGPCQSCNTPDSKQRSIRKWLEDVPLLKQTEDVYERIPKRVRSPTRSLPDSSEVVRALSPRPSSERATSPISDQGRREVFKPSPEEEHQYDSVPSEKRMNFPPPDMIHEAIIVDEIRIPTLTKKNMKAVIEELSNQKGINADSSPSSRKIDYETDSLERSGCRGYSTPTEYADLSSQPSPSLSTALPMDEEMTMRNAVFNKNTGNMTISKINNPEGLQEDEHDYELIVLKKGSLKKQNFYKLPELLQRSNGYSLVSEVYVNNGYNYGSAPSSPSESNCSTFERRTLKIRYEDGEKPGKLLIEVKDCADHYIPVHDSDGFEPDTLDRKPSKIKLKSQNLDDEYVDSLERPSRILLRSNGSFKNPISPPPSQSDGSFNRAFGSLREIYEAKTKRNQSLIATSDGRLLTLEDRHSKRQRRLTTAMVPPDLIPPPPLDATPIYERPKPPRKVIQNREEEAEKPPLPPKNVIGRSANSNNDTVGTPDATWRKQEDPGYLSDSSGSPKMKSESEESCDGHSESGAESVETHSVFFGSFRKPSFLAYGSMDSGVDSMKESQLMNKILIVSDTSFI